MQCKEGGHSFNHLTIYYKTKAHNEIIILITSMSVKKGKGMILTDYSISFL